MNAHKERRRISDYEHQCDVKLTLSGVRISS